MLKTTIGACMPAIIIFFALLLASYWLLLVPIFQSPDEDYHADYVFSLYSRKRLIQGAEAPIAACSHPFIFYLSQATNSVAVKWHNFVKMPVNYGQRSFFQIIDSNAPDEQICAQANTNPFVVAMYPVGYYALAAVWLGLLSCLNNNLSFLFFAARFLSIILLGCGLAFAYLTMRELRLTYKQSLLMLAAIGFFPMVSFVGSYIQPDNLGFALTSICFFLALRWRNSFAIFQQINISVKSLHLPKTLGLAMAALLLTKYQFFLCVGIAIIVMILARAMRARIAIQRILLTLIILLIPSMIAGTVQLWISWGCNLPVIDSTHWHWFPLETELRKAIAHGITALLAHIVSALTDTYRSAYTINGHAFKTFWGCFGWLDTSLVIGFIQLNDALRIAIEIITNIIILLTLASLLKVIIILCHLVKKRLFRRAFDIACSNPVINSYFLFVIFMSLFNIIVYPSFVEQGRHWFPLILSVFLAAAWFAPLVLPKTIRQKFFFIFTVGLLCYSIIGNYYALACIKKRYYEQDKQPVINIQHLRTVSASCFYSIECFDFLDKNTTFIRHSYPIIVPARNDLLVTGYAADILADLPVSAVLLFIDHQKIYQAVYGLESPEAVTHFHDTNYRFSGFGAIIPSKGLSAGKHCLSVKAVSRSGLLLYDAGNDINFFIK